MVDAHIYSLWIHLETSNYHYYFAPMQSRLNNRVKFVFQVCNNLSNTNDHLNKERVNKIWFDFHLTYTIDELTQHLFFTIFDSNTIPFIWLTWSVMAVHGNHM